MKFCFICILTLLCPSLLQGQWKKVNISGNKDLYDVQMLGETAYIAGHNSALLKSVDSGKTWTSLSLTIPSNLRAIIFTSNDTGFVTGENARIQKTYNGGLTWTQKYVRTAAYAYDIQFQGHKGIAVGADMLAVSSNNHGESWYVDTTFTSNKQLNSICILPGGMCWAVGDSGYMIKKMINRRLWTNMKYPSKINFNHISNIGDSILIVCGGMPDSAQAGKYKNIFLISKDSGNTWLETPINEMKIICSAWFTNPDTGFMCGSNGLICKTYDPFVKRGLQLPGTSSSLNSITFFNGIGLTVGDGGTVYRTTNKGGFGLNINAIHDKQFLFYPNPSKGEIHINSEINIVKIEIFDASGKKVAFTWSNFENLLQVNQQGILCIIMYLENGKQIRTTVVNQG